MLQLFLEIFLSFTFTSHLLFLSGALPDFFVVEILGCWQLEWVGCSELKPDFYLQAIPSKILSPSNSKQKPKSHNYMERTPPRHCNENCVVEFQVFLFSSERPWIAETVSVATFFKKRSQITCKNNQVTLFKDTDFPIIYLNLRK